MRTADLLLELPEEMDVDRDLALPGVPRAEERGHRRPLVVRRATAEVAITLPVELERRGLPVRTLRGLDVEVVVDRDRRVPVASIETAVDDRMDLGLEDPRPSAAALEQRHRVFGRPVHVPFPLGFHGDGRDLDNLLQRGLVFGARLSGIGLELFTAES